MTAAGRTQGKCVGPAGRVDGDEPIPVVGGDVLAGGRSRLAPAVGSSTVPTLRARRRRLATWVNLAGSVLVPRGTGLASPGLRQGIAGEHGRDDVDVVRGWRSLGSPAAGA
jgi:hypothetical protein